MGDPDHIDRNSFIDDLVEYPVVSLTYSILPLPREFPCPGRAWVAGKPPYPFDNPVAISLSDPLQFSARRSLD